jgi:hypothetical protein
MEILTASVRITRGAGALTRILKQSRLIGAFRYNARRLWKETTMKRTLTSIACLLMLATAFTQEQKKSAPARPASEENASAAPILEMKIRKAWEDYKKRDKEAFAAILANGFAEVTNDADGIFGKEAELAEMDHFVLSHYNLKDFKLRQVGNGGALMTYAAEYSGTYENAPMQMKAIYGEVWLKVGSDWKLLWVQETKLK